MKTIQLFNKVLLFMSIIVMISITVSASSPNQACNSKMEYQARQQRTPEEVAKNETDWMKKDLALTPEQLAKVNEINLAYANKFHTLREQTNGNRQEMRSRRAELEGQKHTELTTVLSADQIKKYDEIIAARREKRQQHSGD